MSQQNVGAINRMIDGFNARDFDRILAEFDLKTHGPKFGPCHT
jgi:hypothetical protein